MPVLYKSLYMKLIDKFNKKLTNINKRDLVSSYIYSKELPTIQMELEKNVVEARVEFNFFYNTSKAKEFSKFEKVTRIISGTSEDVYKAAAKQASRISLSLSTQFNNEWQKCLMNLLNKPSENKSMLNLGLYKNNSYGLYDVTSPSELLSKKISETEMKLKDVAILAGIDETTLFRHLKGTSEISRDAAIKYAKVFGCDPAEILFNSLSIPVWGTTDTNGQIMIEKMSFEMSEIIPLKNPINVNCPREIYRPDVKAIKIDSPNSSYDDHVAYYYSTNSPLVFEDQIVVVGTKSENRMRYFLGIYKKNKNGRTIDLHTIDTAATDISGFEPDEDFNSFDDVVSLSESQNIVIENITPEFVAPVVALVSDKKVNDPIKSEITKAYEEIYTWTRKGEAQSVNYYKDLQVKNAIQDKLENLVNEDFQGETDLFELIEANKIKSLIKADDKMTKVLSKAAYGTEKDKKQIDREIKKIKYELNEDERKAVLDATDQAIEDYYIDTNNLTPEEAAN